MIGKKKEPFFAFSYGSTNDRKCYAFYVAEGKIHADYRDEEGKTHGFSGLPMPDGFWERLTNLADKNALWDWKAAKLFHRFVINVNEGILNLEALFPDGRKLMANSMNGDPENLEAAAKDIRELFISAARGFESQDK